MSFQAQTSIPTTNPPKQLGGTLDQCFLSGSEVVFASMYAVGHSANVTMYAWDPDQSFWFIFPVDPVLVDPAVNNGREMKRYVVGRSSNGVYLTFVSDSPGEGYSVTVSVRLTNSV